MAYHCFDASCNFHSSERSLNADTSEAPEDASRKATLAEMRQALEEAGVETISRADARTAGIQADNLQLRLLLASTLAQMAATQAGCAFFRKLFLSLSRQRISALRVTQPALHHAAAEGQKAETARKQLDEAAARAARQASVMDELRLSHDARVSELTAEVKSLQTQLLVAKADLDNNPEVQSLRAQLQQTQAEVEQSAAERDGMRWKAAFDQANKMRSFTEEHLVKTRVQRDELRHTLRRLTDREDISDIVSSAVATAGHAANVAQESTAQAGTETADTDGAAGEFANAQGFDVAENSAGAQDSSMTQDSTAAQGSATTGSHITTASGATLDQSLATAALRMATAYELSTAQGPPAVDGSTTTHGLVTADADAATAAEASTTAGDCSSTAEIPTTAADQNSVRHSTPQDSANAEKEGNVDEPKITSDMHSADDNTNAADEFHSQPQDQAQPQIHDKAHMQTHSCDEINTHSQTESHQVLHSHAAFAKTGVLTDPPKDSAHPQIAAVHAQDLSLQQLQRELESKDQLILKQAAQITEHALKAGGHQDEVQRLQTQLKTRELASLLFGVRLVPTRVCQPMSADV